MSSPRPSLQGQRLSPPLEAALTEGEETRGDAALRTWGAAAPCSLLGTRAGCFHGSLSPRSIRPASQAQSRRTVLASTAQAFRLLGGTWGLYQEVTLAPGTFLSWRKIP